MKPYPAMVKIDAEEQAKIDTMKYAHSARYRKQVEREDFWRSPVIRYFFPRYADWTIRENPYAVMAKEDVYTLDHPSPNLSNNSYGDHLQNH